MATNTSFLAFYKKYYKEIRQIIAVVLLVGVVSMYFDQYLLSYFFLDTKYHISVLDWVVVSIGLLMITYWIINLKIGYRYSFHQFLVLLSLSIIYLVIFHTSNQTQFWTFKSPFFDCLSDVPYIRFLHQILLIFYFHLGVQIVSQFSKGKEEPSQNRYLQDIPIKTNDFKFKHITEEIRALIKETKFKSAFSIAVLGKWGQGKSTFIEQLKDEIKGEDYIIIDFLPFYSQKEDELVMDFFTSLKESLRFYSGNITRNIEDYAISLLKIYKRGELESLLKSNALSDKGVKSQFELIKNDIEQIDKKIIVFIDDVDRLNEKEIIQLLKLIRNSSNFPNVYFFLCFDKEYVLHELKSYGSISQHRFLEKFFQLEIVIPEHRNLNLAKNLIEYLHRQGLSEFVDSCKVNPLFVDCLDNYRDIIRFSNQLKFYKLTVGSILKELSNESFSLIVLLQYKFPLAHKVLFTWKDKLLTIVEGYFVPVSRKDFEEIFFENNTEVVYDENDSPTSISWQTIKEYKSNFSDHKLLNSKINIYSEEDFDLIYNICEKLFPRVNKSVSQFNYAHNFFKYYTYTASDILISYEETLYIIQKNDLNQLDILLEEKSNLKYFFEFTIYIVESKSVEYDNILLVLNHIDKRYCDWVGQQELYKLLFSLNDDYPGLNEGIKSNILNVLNDKIFDLYTKLNFMFPGNVAAVKVREWLIDVDVKDLIAQLFEQEQKNGTFKFTDFLNSIDFVRGRFDSDLHRRISNNYLENNLERVLVHIIKSTGINQYILHNDYNIFFDSLKDVLKYFESRDNETNLISNEFKRFLLLHSSIHKHPVIFNFKILDFSKSQFELDNINKVGKFKLQIIISYRDFLNLNIDKLVDVYSGYFVSEDEKYHVYNHLIEFDNLLNVKEQFSFWTENIRQKVEGMVDDFTEEIDEENYKFSVVDGNGFTLVEILHFCYTEI